ncbi:ROK family protein [Streptomyces sp. PTM05]|uniref:ROK family protein n=1 Tax=Streptantibioticus parmotrematis TaxID=2873249 RepID=A0ABS7QQS6_9ACTN|nr:ROK family transcriptional regulator [Streptantibioticus parmotrematis]MBY8885288.1 ROK family protein [Streptantibioticus parmotrematis]
MSEEPAGGDLARLRRLNARTVVGVLRAEAPLTLTEIAAQAGLSRATVEDVIRELAGRGWIAEAERTAGTVGRPARRFRFRADAGRVLGVEIGTHTVRALVTDLDGRTLGAARSAVDPSTGRRRRLAAVDRVVARCLEKAQVAAAEVYATGVATTGLVDGAGRVMHADSPPEWTGVDLTEHVGRLVGGSVLVDNDSRLAALAERWRGTARFADDMVYVLAGPRCGSALISNGRLLRGFSNAAGEIGALSAVRWSDAPGHLMAWAREHAESPQAEQDPKRVFAAARDGDRSAATAVRRYVRDLAVGTSALVLTLDPQLVVLGGEFSQAADLLVEPLVAELNRTCVRTPEVKASTLGEECAVLGAVRLALDHAEQLPLERSAGL